MESKNLNDIVIEDSDNSKKAQLKNILTLLALLFIILVISIVITKLILGSDDSDSNVTTSITDGITETTGDAATALSNGAAATAATATALATTVTGDKKKESDTKSTDTNTNASTNLPDRNSTSKKKLSLRDHPSKDTKSSGTSSTSKAKKKVSEHRPSYTPVKRNTTPKKAVTHPTRGYYIKVGAFKDPSNAIKKVKANSLRYRKINTKDGMATRVLVGPYYSQKDAQNDLAKVKSKIAPDAYITKIK